MDHPEKLVPTGTGDMTIDCHFWTAVSFIRKSTRQPVSLADTPDHDNIDYTPERMLFGYGVWAEIFRTPTSRLKAWSESDTAPWSFPRG